MKFNKVKQPMIAGLIGSALLFGMYWIILYIASGDLMHSFEQFLQYKWWMTPMIVGFGVQVGMYWYVKKGLHLKESASDAAVSTSAASSTGSMVLCCLHHFVDFLPVLGFSSLAASVARYQNYFFAFGIISNFVGICMMFYLIKTKKCFHIKKLFSKKL